jgi:hypothetical protein
MLERQIFCADVDIDNEKALARRFGLDSSTAELPTVLMFRRKQMYSKQNAVDMGALEHWVLEGYRQESGQPVPPERSGIALFVDDVLGHLQTTTSALGFVSIINEVCLHNSEW